MRKGSLLSLLFTMMFPIAYIQAKETTPIETFIRQVNETNIFVNVNNIWLANENFDKTDLLKSVSKVMPLTIDYNNVAGLLKQNNTAINLTIPGNDGTTYTIELAQYSFLSSTFQVHAMGYNNSDGICDYTPGLYYSGIVAGIPGSVAAFSFFKNEVYGVFSIPGEGNYVVAPNTLTGPSYSFNQNYVLYNDNDLLIKELAPKCATDNLPTRYMNSAAKTTTTLNNNVYNNCSYVRVFEQADYATFLKKGNTTNVTNYLTALFNNQSTLYRNEGVPIMLNYVQIDTVADAYQSMTSTNSVNYLDKFGYLTQGTMHGSDVAILVSSHSGNMGGVAWLESACTGYYATDSAGPYAFCNITVSTSTSSTAFPTYSWDVEVITHEMGHTVGSPHTHACCWNPPARNTAIDGCYTLEGSCAIPSPAHPPGGGTIMSYCHLTSVGINFSLGFGQQPGDTIRYYLFHNFSTFCGVTYNPNIALSKVSRTISANRECTDLFTGITYYWKDNNTVTQTDDTLVLMLNKNGNNIGNLNTTGFSVTATTDSGYGSSTAPTILFPTGMPGQLAPNYSMRRYWKINATTAPTSAVEVIFPFLGTDTLDVDGSAGAHALTSYRMYKINSPVNPDPLIDSFRYTTTGNVSIYNYGSATSTTRWTLTTSGNTLLAHMSMINLSGGGSAFYSNLPNDAENISNVNSGIYIYPNPTNDQWFISVANNNSNEQPLIQLYGADGKLVHFQILQTGTVNTVNAGSLPTGIYFYRIISNSNAYTGSLIKK